MVDFDHVLDHFGLGSSTLRFLNKLMCYPQQFGRSWRVFGYLPRNSREPHQPSAPEQSGTSSAICTGTLRNLISNLHQNRQNPPGSHLHRNPPEPHQPSAPEPSGASLAICTRTLRNLISYLTRNQPSAPEPFGTSSAICTGRIRNPPEPSPEPGVAAAPDHTRAILG